MAHPTRPGAGCARCGAPLSVRTRARCCGKCRARHRCPVCGNVHFGRSPGSFCGACKRMMREFHQAYGLHELQPPPNGTRNLRVETYAERAAQGLPLFGPVPVVSEVHHAGPGSSEPGPRGVRPEGKGPRCP